MMAIALDLLVCQATKVQESLIMVILFSWKIDLVLLTEELVKLSPFMLRVLPVGYYSLSKALLDLVHSNCKHCMSRMGFLLTVSSLTKQLFHKYAVWQ